MYFTGGVTTITCLKYNVQYKKDNSVISNVTELDPIIQTTKGKH